MDGTNPKVSFIPKGSLVREESFLERRRPQSAIGLIAGFVFVSSIIAYATLYYLNDSLNKTVADKTIEINKAQQEFNDEPKVGEAKVFRARADLAHELLNSHKVTSPVFTFLSDYTTESILYDKFSFKNGPEGGILELSGEAPTYASLAYQVDVLKGQTKALSGFAVRDISLSKYGTVTFAFTMMFAPDYLLYTNNVSGLSVANKEASKLIETSAPVDNTLPSDTSAPITPSGTVAPVTESNPITDTSVSSPSNDWAVVPIDTATTSEPTTTTEKQSILRSLWSKFKFW